MTALTILDGIFAAATMLALLAIAGFPIGWLLALAELSPREVQWSALRNGSETTPARRLPR